MKINYKDWNPKPETVRIVETAEEIIREYEAQGYVLTLRQLYYQFVSRDLIPNTERSYKNLGNTITKARMAGMISWEALEDRTRGHKSYYFEESSASAIRTLPALIGFDQWDRQATYIEVWVEKEALGNVVARACNPYLTPYMACKGYLSASEAWRAGQRFGEKLNQSKRCVLIHLGDHDPSGIDMTRDNKDRLDTFTGHDVYDHVEVKRIALNMDQVDQYSPPPNPAKLSDTRAKDYIPKYGRVSWELDALEPRVIEELITGEITQHIDQDIWDEVTEEEREKKKLLRKLYDKWPAVKEMLEED